LESGAAAAFFASDSINARFAIIHLLLAGYLRTVIRHAGIGSALEDNRNGLRDCLLVIHRDQLPKAAVYKYLREPTGKSAASTATRAPIAFTSA
jgi:hypothetical protein